MERLEINILGTCEPQDLVRISDGMLLELEIRLRQARQNFFPSEIFSDPAWDMLLFLAHQESGSRFHSTKSLCLSSGAPMTTALRYIALMEKCRLIQRFCDPRDGRRIFISLTDHGAMSIKKLLKFCSSKSTSIQRSADLGTENNFQNLH